MRRSWFAVGLAFVAFVYPMYEYGWFGATLHEPSTRPGADAAMMFVAAYLLEYAIAFDGLIVLRHLCRAHRIPSSQEPRILAIALAASLVLRGIGLAGAAALSRSFAWPGYVFGAFVLYTALRAWRVGTPWLPAGALIPALVLSDLAFAGDSVAVLSITETTFIVVTSNVLATVALRGSYFTAGDIRGPRLAIRALLGFAGLQLLGVLDLSPAVTLAVIAGLVGIGFAARPGQSR